MTFYDGSTPLGTGTLAVVGGSDVATLSISSLAVGTYATLHADYAGDSSFNTSTSSNLSQTINKANTSTSLAADVNPAVFGQYVTFTATVAASSPGSGTPTGTVTFYDGSTSLGTGTLAVVGGQNVATLSTSALAVGTHATVHAVYAGDANFNTSTSANFSETVNQDSSFTNIWATPDLAVLGQPVTLTAESWGVTRAAAPRPEPSPSMTAPPRSAPARSP